jgi:hypothetical protein
MCSEDGIRLFIVASGESSRATLAGALRRDLAASIRLPGCPQGRLSQVLSGGTLLHQPDFRVVLKGDSRMCSEEGTRSFTVAFCEYSRVILAGALRSDLAASTRLPGGPQGRLSQVLSGRNSLAHCSFRWVLEGDSRRCSEEGTRSFTVAFCEYSRVILAGALRRDLAASTRLPGGPQGRLSQVLSGRNSLVHCSFR